LRPIGCWLAGAGGLVAPVFEALEALFEGLHALFDALEVGLLVGDRLLFGLATRRTLPHRQRRLAGGRVPAAQPGG